MSARLILRRVPISNGLTPVSGPVSVLTPHVLAAFQEGSYKDAAETGVTELERELFRPPVAEKSSSRVDVQLNLALRQLKGVLAVVKSFQQSNRLFSSESSLYRCDYFNLSFYPPEHFLALARKSKPALHITFNGGYVLNGNLLPDAMDIKSKLRFANSKEAQHKLQQLDKVIQQSGSRNPMDWSYQRSKFRKFLREQFLRALLAERLYTCDGLYHFAIKVLPDANTEEDYIKHINRAVARRPSSLGWVNSANKRIDISYLNLLLKRNLLPYEYKFVRS